MQAWAMSADVDGQALPFRQPARRESVGQRTASNWLRTAALDQATSSDVGTPSSYVRTLLATSTKAAAMIWWVSMRGIRLTVERMAAPSPRWALELLGSGHRGKVVAPSRIPLRLSFNPSRRSGGLYACGYDIGRHIADTMTARR